MKRYLLINLIALAMVCVFCSNEVDAFRPAQLIAEIGSSDGQNEANAPATHTGYVETNRPFHGVTWYVNGDHNYSTLGSNNQDTSYLNLSDLDGEVWGRPYSIKPRYGVAMFLDPLMPTAIYGIQNGMCLEFINQK